MTTKTLRPALAALVATVLGSDVSDILDAIDAAEKRVKAYCEAKGYNFTDLVLAEKRLIADNDLDLLGYMHFARVGQAHRLDRATRIHVWTIVAGDARCSLLVRQRANRREIRDMWKR